MAKDYVRRSGGKISNIKKKKPIKSLAEKKVAAKKPLKKNSPKKTAASTNSPLSWPRLIALFIIVVALATATYLYKHRHPAVKSAPITQAQPSEFSSATVHSKKPLPPVHFVFKPGVKSTDQAAASDNNQANWYVVQVASENDSQKAELLREKLRSLGYHAHLVEKQSGNITWYRVQLGPFKTSAQATRVQTALQNKHVLSLVVGVE